MEINLEAYREVPLVTWDPERWIKLWEETHSSSPQVGNWEIYYRFDSERRKMRGYGDIDRLIMKLEDAAFHAAKELTIDLIRPAR